MSSTTTIALATLPPRPTTPPQRPATPGISTNISSPSTVSRQTGTPPAAASPSHSPPNIQTAAPATTEDGPPPSNLPLWVQKAKPYFTLCSSTLKFTIAVVGVSYTIYIGLAGLDFQRWSARDDSLQSCLALESHSQYCNATIEAGVEPPPNWKRDAATLSSTASIASWYFTLSRGPGTVAAAVVVTVAAILVATVYFRPRMKPFHPVISNVRMAAIYIVRGITDSYGLRWTASFEPSQNPWSPILEDLEGIAILPGKDIGLSSPTGTPLVPLEDESDVDRKANGPRIGIFYESDDDSTDDDDEEGDSNFDPKCFTGPHSMSNNEPGGDGAAIHFSHSQENGLMITSSDLEYFWKVYAKYSRDDGDPVVSHHADGHEQKPFALREASIDTLVFYLVCDFDVHIQPVPKLEHQQHVLSELASLLNDTAYDPIRAEVRALPRWSRRSLMVDVLEELSTRVEQDSNVLAMGPRKVAQPAATRAQSDLHEIRMRKKRRALVQKNHTRSIRHWSSNSRHPEWPATTEAKPDVSFIGKVARFWRKAVAERTNGVHPVSLGSG